MSERPTQPRLSRRNLLRLGGRGAVVTIVGGAFGYSVLGRGNTPSVVRGASPLPALVPAAATPSYVRLVATDGFMSYPGRRTPSSYPDPVFDDPGDGLFSFGFRSVLDSDVAGGNAFDAPVGELVSLYKGRVTNPAPILAVDESSPAREAPVYLKMSNLGFELRPDLDDAHSVHWHGFRQQIAVMDGVPEASVAVPPLRDFPYYFAPHDAGTYIYHCHFEDTEHVQMGMDGIIFVRPTQDQAPLNPGERYAYNDGDGSTRYDREFTLLLNEIDQRPHDLLVLVQEFIWSEYRAQYFVINGRSYPDTVRRNGDPSGIFDGGPSDGGDPLPLQPVSALVQANAGDRVLLRLSNLGFYQHSMQLAGIPLRLVGADATLLRGPGGADLSSETNVIDCGPGESRDAILTAPAHTGGAGPDAYVFKNRNVDRLANGPDPANRAANGLGGMATEVHVYPAGTLPPQTQPNELFTP